MSLNAQGAQYACVVRWEGAAQCGTAWLGHALDPVRIEVAGKFTFVLVKMENRQGSSRLLVRGRYGCSQAVLMHDFDKEVCQPSSACMGSLVVSRARRSFGIPSAVQPERFVFLSLLECWHFIQSCQLAEDLTYHALACSTEVHACSACPYNATTCLQRLL